MQTPTCNPVLSRISTRMLQRKSLPPRVAMGEWLDELLWDYFITCTAHYEMSENQARRAMKAFYAIIKKWSPDARLFWVSEPNDRRFGCHTHGLLHIGRIAHLNNSDIEKLILKAWHVASGAAGQKMKQSNYTTIKEYIQGMGAHHYIAKYLDRPHADYDIHFGVEQENSKYPPRYVKRISFNRRPLISSQIDEAPPVKSSDWNTKRVAFLKEGPAKKQEQPMIKKGISTRGIITRELYERDYATAKRE